MAKAKNKKKPKPPTYEQALAQLPPVASKRETLLAECPRAHLSQ
jgi:hypothetical protein